MDRVDDLTALSGDELAEQRATAMAEYDRVAAIDPGDLTDDDVTALEAAADYVAEIDAEDQRRDGEQQARADRAAAAAARIAAPVDTEVEPEADPDDDEVDDPEPAEVDEPTAVAAAASRTPARRSTGLARRASRPAPVVTPEGSNVSGITITAAADVNGFAMGQRLDDIDHTVRAFMARAKALPTNRLGGKAGMKQRYGVATLTREYGDGLIDTNPDFTDPLALVAAAANEKRLPGGSLAASAAQSLTAAGWCAPSETLYGFCSAETLAGLWSGPEIGISRGGVRFTAGPDYSDIYTNCGFSQTEAEAIAGTEKNCCTVECPPFEEVRLDVIGYCVKAGILTNAAYPELVRRWLEATLIAVEHQKNTKILAAIEAELAPSQTYADLGSTAFTAFVALSIASEGLREAYAMALDATLEVVLPAWSKVAFKEDIANRTYQTQPVTDAQLNSEFAARNLAVQWVRDWHPLTQVADQCVLDLPATIPAMLYPAGTFVLGTTDVISLDAMYDSTDLVQNIYTAAFAEDGWLLLHQCFDGCLIELPLCISGQTGAADFAGCASSGVVLP